MPMAIISDVSEARNLLPDMDCSAIDMFSRSEVLTAIWIVQILYFMTPGLVGLLQAGK